MPDSIGYDVPSGFTAFDVDLVASLADLPTAPVDLCRAAQALVVLPDLAAGFGIPEERLAEKSLRGASDILRALYALDEGPVGQSRSFPNRVVGTCRHFAVLSCAFLRHRGIAARARCGFASYFVPQKFVDHWVVEYWHDGEGRWIRIDSEILGFEFVNTPADLEDGEFLSGGEAWTWCREGRADPSQFGVVGAPHAWGIAEVRGNAIRDLAALNKVEMLPWDEWGRMESSYNGLTGPEFDGLIDAIAATSASNDETSIRQLYAVEDLAVPQSMLR